MDTLKSMTPDQRAAAEALAEAHQAAKPVAVEEDAPAVFSPGVVFFVDSQYQAVSPDTATPWPWIRLHLESLLGLLPMQHRLDYWRSRIERGATLALAFTSSKDWQTEGVGILNCELSDEGKPIVLVAVCTFEPLSLEHAARIAEIAALGLGAEQVHLWTPKSVPMVAGYEHRDCWFGQLQVANVRPIQ
jgi:hypothetical protein